MGLYFGNERVKLHAGSYDSHLNHYIAPPITYLTFSSPNTFSISVSNPLWDGTLEYSTNKTSWATWDGSEISGTVLYIRGTDNTKIGGDASKPWGISGTNISCNGNIENLLDYQTVLTGEHPSMADDCYLGMFRDCTGLITAPELPATTLTYRCYGSMFRNCTNLTASPELPATTLTTACYLGMFYDCTSLTTIPELPATTLPAMCYSIMFYNCTGIKFSSTQTSAYTKAYRIPTTGTGTIASPTSLNNMFANTGGTFTGTPSINTTYYLDESNTIV